MLPLVGSMMTVSLLSRPLRSAASIMAMPMRSLTLPSGLKNSHLRRICVAGSTPRLAGMRFRRTSGVWPTVSTMLL